MKPAPADAAAPASLSVEDFGEVLSIDRAQEDNLRIKDAISQVVAEHPLADGSLSNRKQVYNAVLAMRAVSPHYLPSGDCLSCDCPSRKC